MIRLSYLFTICVAAALLSGCVADKAYRRGHSVLHEKLRTRDFDPTQVTPPGSNNSTRIEDVEWGYTLSFLEFGDDGKMFEPEQLSRAIAEIGNFRSTHRGPIGRAALTPAERQELPLVVVFVHGWKNNASEVRAMSGASVKCWRDSDSRRRHRFSVFTSAGAGPRSAFRS